MSETNNSPNSGPVLLAITFTLAVVATTIVILRFWSRKLVNTIWSVDDWLAAVALVLHHGLLGVTAVCVKDGGLGKDIAVAVAEKPHALAVLFKGLLAFCFLYGFSSPLIKFSVLAFYWRIFIFEGIRRRIYVIGLLNLGWLIAILVVNIVQCRPISFFWDKSGEGQCLDPVLYFTGNSTANCVIDVLIVALPIREVLKLRMAASKKLGVCAVFAVGGIVVVASFVRFISLLLLYKSGATNVTRVYVTPWIATVVEIYIAIIGACLPTLMPVYKKVRYGDPMKSSIDTKPSPRRSTSLHVLETIGGISSRRLKHGVRCQGSFERLDVDSELDHRDPA